MEGAPCEGCIGDKALRFPGQETTTGLLVATGGQ